MAMLDWGRRDRIGLGRVFSLCQHHGGALSGPDTARQAARADNRGREPIGDQHQRDFLTWPRGKRQCARPTGRVGPGRP